MRPKNALEVSEQHDRRRKALSTRRCIEALSATRLRTDRHESNGAGHREHDALRAATQEPRGVGRTDSLRPTPPCGRQARRSDRCFPSTPPLRPMVLRRFRPHPATSPRQQDRRGKRNRQGASKGVCGTGSGAHPHSAAYPHLAPSRPSAFGRLSTSGPQPLIRAWRRHQGKKRRVSRISLVAHSRMAAGLQEPPRTSL